MAIFEKTEAFVEKWGAQPTSARRSIFVHHARLAQRAGKWGLANALWACLASSAEVHLEVDFDIDDPEESEYFALAVAGGVAIPLPLVKDGGREFHVLPRRPYAGTPRVEEAQEALRLLEAGRASIQWALGGVDAPSAIQEWIVDGPEANAAHWAVFVWSLVHWDEEEEQ